MKLANGFQSSTGRMPPIPMKDLYLDKISFFLDEWCEENGFVWWYNSDTGYIRIDFNEEN